MTTGSLSDLKRLAEALPYESQADWGHGWTRVERHRTEADALAWLGTYGPRPNHDGSTVPTRVVRWADDPGYAHLFQRDIS